MSKIINYLGRYLEMDPAGITAESHLTRDLGITSFEMVDLICELEEVYGFEIKAEEMADIEYVKDVAMLLEEN